MVGFPGKLTKTVMMRGRSFTRTAPIPPPGKLFAAQGTDIFDVTAGGTGPWIAEVGVTGTTDYWNGVNFQNSAGAFLTICNEAGGYAIYNGTIWSMPTMGGGAGQIANVDPLELAFVTEYQRRLWFVRNDSTEAWYLATESITGAATKFDFGPQFKHGGYLVALATWTVDGGAGLNDHLVAVSSQGDVVVYEGTDPSSIDTFHLVGCWYVGPLPNGRRCIEQDGYDVNILSQIGIVRVSKILESRSIAALNSEAITNLVSPLIGRLMTLYSNFEGWQVKTIAKDSLVLLGLPFTITSSEGEFLAFKTPTQGWSIVEDVPYACFTSIGNLCFSGTRDGRVVKAFDGALDNMPADSNDGDSITCAVLPGYTVLGSPVQNKRVTMFRPSFTTDVVPEIRFVVLFDFSPELELSVPTVPATILPGWDEALWDDDIWSGGMVSLHGWFGATGVGFAATVQMNYIATGGTLLTNLDLFALVGGIL